MQHEGAGKKYAIHWVCLAWKRAAGTGQELRIDSPQMLTGDILSWAE